MATSPQEEISVVIEEKMQTGMLNEFIFQTGVSLQLDYLPDGRTKVTVLNLEVTTKGQAVTNQQSMTREKLAEALRSMGLTPLEINPL